MRRLKAYLQHQSPGGAHVAATDEVQVPAPAQGVAQHPMIRGANCYYLLTRSASEELRHEVISVLDGALRAGFTVLRTWAFNDGDGWNALQTAPGVYDERVFAGLDWLLQQCQARGLQLMLVLVNNWEDYGGAKQYVRWSRGAQPSGASAAAGAEGTTGASSAAGGHAGGCDVSADEFWSSPACMALYQRYARDVLGRVNTLTGVAYKDDPTIYAWDLANEPRCDSDPSGAAIQAWVDSAAAFIKSLGPRQLVTVGLEGFFGPSTPELMQHNPYGHSHGCDFVRNFSSPHLDFACIHIWVDQWRTEDSEQQRCAWACQWITAHAQACRLLPGCKPLVLQEYGKRGEGEVREGFFGKVAEALCACEAEGCPLAGSFLWHLAARSYPDYDGFTVYVD